MRIAGVTAYPVSIPFRRPFGHSLQWRDKTDAIILCLTSESEATGWGEILPRSYLTGETVATVLSRDLPEMAGRWRGRAFENRDEVFAALREENHREWAALATRAGWELAVLDLAGKILGFAAGDALGAIIGHELEAGAVIGFDVPTDKLEKYCLLARLAGRRHIKVKVGQTDDLRRLQIVHAVLGPVPIRADANGAWSADEAISQVRRMQDCGVGSIEEPVSARDFDGMRKVREKTGITVVADESLCTLADARSIVAEHAADVFNIRIGKCGGFFASLDLVALAKEAGLSCQLGTLVGETGILSRASEIFGERIHGFDFLEGKGQSRRLLLEDVVEATGAHGNDLHGLGIAVSFENVSRWAASAERIPCGVQGVAR